MKHLSIFEPQIQKHYANIKKHVLELKTWLGLRKIEEVYRRDQKSLMEEISREMIHLLIKPFLRFSKF